MTHMYNQGVWPEKVNADKSDHHCIDQLSVYEHLSHYLKKVAGEPDGYCRSYIQDPLKM